MKQALKQLILSYNDQLLINMQERGQGGVQIEKKRSSRSLESRKINKSVHSMNQKQIKTVRGLDRSADPLQVSVLTHLPFIEQNAADEFKIIPRNVYLRSQSQ